MTKDMTAGSPAKLLLLFAIPMLIGNIFQQVYSLADTVIIGRTLGVEGLAAIGSVGGVLFFIHGFGIGVTSGLGIVIAQRFGTKNEERIRKSITISVWITLFTTILITILSVLFAEEILLLMNTPVEILKEAEAYFLVLMWGSVAIMAFNLLSNILRSLGDSKLPLVILMISSILNVVLDYVFIVWFSMGVAGAALATVAAQLFASFLCFVYIRKKMAILSFSREDWRMQPGEFSLPLKISLPIGLQASIISIGLIVLQKSLNGFGPEAVGGYAIAQKLDIMATLPIASIGIAMATFAAQNYGAGLYSRIWEGVRISLLLTFVYSIVLGGALLYFGTDIIRLLFKQNDPAVLAYAHTYFIATASFYLVLATLIILRYTLQGVGDNTAPTFGGVMEMVARVLVPLGFSGLLGYQAVAFANPVAWVGATIPMMYAYRQLKRKLTLLEENRIKEAGSERLVELSD